MDRHLVLRTKRIFSIVMTLSLAVGLTVCAYAAETTTTTTTTPYTTTTTGAPYTSTTANIGNTDPRLGDSAINASNASKVNAVGQAHSVGGYTKNQLYTMRASKVLELLTGDYGVYDKTGHRLGTAKEMFNGVWDDIDPASVMGRLDGPGGSSGTPLNMNPGDYTIETVSKSMIKLYIPDNAVYANVQNLSGVSGGKLVPLKSLTVKKWNFVARYSEVYDKDYKRVTFTRENGETY